MAGIFNQQKRQQSLQKNSMFDNLSEDQLDQVINELRSRVQAEKQQQQQQQSQRLQGGIQAGLGTAGDLFLQKAGMQAPQQAKQERDPIQDFYAKEQIKQQFKDPDAFYERLAQEDAFKKANDPATIIAQMKLEQSQKEKADFEARQQGTPQLSQTPPTGQPAQQPGFVPGQEPVQPFEQTQVPTEQFGQQPTGQIPEFIEVPTGKTDPVTGVPETKVIRNPQAKSQEKLTEQKAESNLKQEEKIESAKRNTFSSFNLVSGTLKELSDTYVEAFREGGVGSLLKDVLSSAALFVGGDVAENFPSTAAIPGQKTEVITRIMPILTQQGDKPGSVRLVSTVFEKLELTLPDKKTPPKNARRMMKKTLINMFRFTRASQMLGLTNENVENMSEAQLATFSKKIEDLANKIEIKGEEKAQLDNLINTALRSLDELIIEREGGITKALKETQEPEGVLMEDANGNKAIVNPQTGEVIREVK